MRLHGGAAEADAKGEVVQSISGDRSFHVTPDQQKMGTLLDKSILEFGKYTLESVAQDRENLNNWSCSALEITGLPPPEAVWAFHLMFLRTECQGISVLGRAFRLPGRQRHSHKWIT